VTSSLTSASPESFDRARVLIVESNEDGTVGGSHQALFDLAVRLDPAGFEPIVLFYEQNVFVDRLRASGVEVVVFDEIRCRERASHQSTGRFAHFLQLGPAVISRRRELLRLRIDLLHLNNSPRVGNDTWLPAARLAGIPCVVNAMGDAGRPAGLVHRWLYRRFDQYLAISRYMADMLREQNVDPDRIHVVYLGVDFEALRSRVRRTREAVRSELGVTRDQRLVLMVGNIRPWKGQHVVIEAVRMLPKETLARMRVCFAGATAKDQAHYDTELRDQVGAAGLGDCVTFLGPRTDTPDLYNAADIAVHASTSPEPFGLVVPEAMALGCAVIAASFGGPAEVIVRGTGMLCDPARPEDYAHALEQLVTDEPLRQAIIAAAPARAALFGIERTVEGTVRFYERALGRVSAGRET
jgi:glycosyltransferase involved in cell wall biosynthesis